MTLMLLIFPLIAILCTPALRMVLGRPKYLGDDSRAKAPPNCASVISIIIPARNEEANITKLLKTIQQQKEQPIEVIVVNDNSADRTSEIARQYGATVIDSQPLPNYWNGKPWACHQGAEKAQGQWLLFIDADTELKQGALEKISSLTAANKVYSICPYHRIEQTYEELSAFFNVLMLAGSGAFSNDANSKEALFGQCMLISREHYQAVGGHAAVKKEVLENFQLASKLDSLGIPRDCYLGKGTISMRMFPTGFHELWDSWQKGFSSGAANSSLRALFWSSVWISGLMFTLVSLGLLLTPYTSTAYFLLTAASYVTFSVQCWRAFRLAGSFSFLNALFFPIALLFYQVLFFSSILRKHRGKATQWKGRDV